MHDILIILFRTICGYLLLIVLMKFMGKREIGQLSLFDLLILLTIVDVMVVGIENFNSKFSYSIIPMVLIAIIQKIISYIGLKSPNFRNFIDGKVSIIIIDGKINVNEMKKNRYNMDDLYTQLREKGYTSPYEIKFAILENNGKLNVFPYDKNIRFPLPIIVSGKLNKEYLKYLDLTKEDIECFIKQEGYNKIKDIYGLDYINNSLRIIKPRKK